LICRRQNDTSRQKNEQISLFKRADAAGCCISDGIGAQRPRLHVVNYRILGRHVKLKYVKVRRVFTVDMEQLLVDYVKKAAQIYHGSTSKNIRELAYKLAQSNSLQMPPMCE